MEIPFDASQLRQRLEETIAWCDHRLALSVAERGQSVWKSYRDPDAPEMTLPDDLKRCLRSAELRPPALFDHQQEKRLTPPIDGHRAEMVEALAQRRAELVRQKNLTVAGSSGLAGGRLLVYQPDHTLSDGGAYNDSEGYIDGDEGVCNDVPPWDSWMRFVPLREGSFLLSYVPPLFIALVEEGIQCSCSSCLFWLDEPDERHFERATLEALSQLNALMRG